MDRTSSQPQVRSASPADADACAAIYAPYVTDTAITFETVPPGAEEMAERISAAVRSHAWVVLEDEGRVAGYAYGAPFKSRAAYRWSCEVSVYLELDRRRTGAGRALHDALFARLVERGFRTAVAGMTLPNDASVGLHRAMASSPSGPIAASAGSTTRGTTSPGHSACSPSTGTRPQHRSERKRSLARRHERDAASACAPASPSSASAGVELRRLGRMGFARPVGTAAAGLRAHATGAGQFMIVVSEAITALGAARSSEMVIMNLPRESRTPDSV